MNLYNRTHFSHLKTYNVTVSAPKPPPKQVTNTEGYVLQVEQIIDLGNGNRIATLKQVAGITAFNPTHEHNTIPYEGFRPIPQKIDDLTLITTQKSQNDLVCIQSTLHYYFDAVQLEKIVPDVLMPKDLLIIEYNDMGRSSYSAMRPVKNNKGNNKESYALSSSDTAG